VRGPDVTGVDVIAGDVMAEDVVELMEADPVGVSGAEG
jgi:hypothetical protein